MDRDAAVQLTAIVLNAANLTAIALRALARGGLLSGNEITASAVGLQSMAKRLEMAGHDDLASQLWAVARQIEMLPGSE